MTSEWGYYNINTFTSVTIYWLRVETMLILFILPVFSKFIIIYYNFMFLQIDSLSFWNLISCKSNPNIFVGIIRGWEWGSSGKALFQLLIILHSEYLYDLKKSQRILWQKQFT